MTRLALLLLLALDGDCVTDGLPDRRPDPVEELWDWSDSCPSLDPRAVPKERLGECLRGLEEQGCGGC